MAGGEPGAGEGGAHVTGAEQGQGVGEETLSVMAFRLVEGSGLLKYVLASGWLPRRKRAGSGETGWREMTVGRRRAGSYVCGVDAAMDVIGGKWKVLILWELHVRPRRFGALRRELPGVTEKVLAAQLREMAADGIVHREVFEEVPPRVVYSLTERGEALNAALEPLGGTGAGRTSSPGTPWAPRRPYRRAPSRRHPYRRHPYRRPLSRRPPHRRSPPADPGIRRVGRSAGSGAPRGRALRGVRRSPSGARRRRRCPGSRCRASSRRRR
ncbi:hypothetical protein GCM10020295_56180 [Streptomyces cinereospinus]